MENFDCKKLTFENGPSKFGLPTLDSSRGDQPKNSSAWELLLEPRAARRVLADAGVEAERLDASALSKLNRWRLLKLIKLNNFSTVLGCIEANFCK